jgi:hypothetical protein
MNTLAFAPRQMVNITSEIFPDTLHLFASLLVAGIQPEHGRSESSVAVGTATCP